MTRLEIRRRILHALNDSAEQPVFWSLSEVDDYIQDAQEVLAEESEGLTRTFTVPRRAGHMIYHLAGIGENIMVPYRIWLPDLSCRLEAWSITDLDARQETWMQTTGNPYIWFPIDWQAFGIWPVPASPGGWLEVSCYVWPEPLTTDNSRPEFLPADHEALVMFGEEEGYLKQHMGLQAVDSSRQFARRFGKAGTRSSVEQMASAFHVRERSSGGNTRDSG